MNPRLPKRIAVQQSGGFIGYQHRELDLSELDQGERAAVEQLLTQSGLLSGQLTDRGAPASENVGYEVALDFDGEKKRLFFSGLEQGEDMVRLLRYVLGHGRPLPPP